MRDKMIKDLFKSKTKKAQAAMEYLMTYGWAIFIIVIVAGALFYVISTIKSPESCSFTGTMGFSCSNSPLVYTAGGNDNSLSMDIGIRNQFGKSTKVHKMLCTDAPESEIKENDPALSKCYYVQSSMISTGSSQEYKGITCCDVDGNPISMSPGNQLKANLIVWYNYATDPSTNGQYSVHRRASAHIIANVLEGNTANVNGSSQ